MTEEEISELYARLAFQYESAIDTLLAKRVIDTDLATTAKEKFYDSLNEEKLRTSEKIRDYHKTVIRIRFKGRRSTFLSACHTSSPAMLFSTL